MVSAHDSPSRASGDAVAVLGAACRFPGGAGDPDSFWRLLAEGIDATIDMPPDRWDVARFYSPERQPGCYYTRRGGFVPELYDFDARFFDISSTEALSMDPQQRMLLEVCWEALEDAAIAPRSLAGTRTGVFVGLSSSEFLNEFSDSLRFGGTGGHPSIASGRVSHLLGLAGPSIVVDTACSSSLVALHLARESLVRGEIEFAVVAGVNAITTPMHFRFLSELGALAPDGRCKTFSANADGFARAEGCGALVLTREQSLGSRDRVRALVRASALNNDGRSATLISPRGEAQAELLREVYTKADIEPGQLGYVEAHGTGTVVGDPIEIGALLEVLGARTPGDDARLHLGAVKSNLGHMESAAGLSSLLKTVLSLEKGELPPNLHVDRVNPRIELCDADATIVTQRTPYPAARDRPRLAGVSAFGFSGTNAHVILQEPPIAMPTSRPAPPPHLLCLSARTPTALAALAARYRRYLREHPSTTLADACFTAAVGRSPLEHRAALVVDEREACDAGLLALAEGHEPDPSPTGPQIGARGVEAPRVAFLFTGQGSQHPGMGAELHAREPVFRAAFDACIADFDARLADELAAAGFGSLREIMFEASEAPAGARTIDQTGWAQPSLFTVQYALVELWASWGVEPFAAIGHSIGELAAACAAGSLRREIAIEIVSARARMMQALPRGGAMVSLSTTLERVEAALAESSEDVRAKVSIAAVNGARSVVISGEREDTLALAAALAESNPGVRGRELAVSHAFHSARMDPMLDDFEAAITGLDAEAPRCLLISNLSGAPFPEDRAPDASYWRRHVREAVRFEQGLRAAVDAGATVLLEIGPHPVLTALGQGSLEVPGLRWAASLHREQDDAQTIVSAAAELFTAGVDLDWSGFHANRGGRKVRLPTYPFERKRYWLPAPSPGLGGRAVHPLLGARLPSATATAPFIVELGPGHPPYLDDHRVHGLPVFPGAGFVEQSLAAARELLGPGPCTLRNLSFERALVLPEGGQRRVQLLATENSNGLSVEIHSQLGDEGGARDEDAAWVAHARGDLSAGVPTADSVDPATWRQTVLEPIDVDTYYTELANEGLDYGPSFRGITQLVATGEGQAVASIRLPPPLREDADAYLLHPSVLDACLQTVGAARRAGASQAHGADTYLPVGVDTLELHRSAHELSCRATILRADADLIAADLELADAAGLVARIRGLKLQRVDRAALRRLAQVDVREWLYEIMWESLGKAAPAPAEPASADAPWLLLADRGGSAEALASELERRGAACRLICADTLASSDDVATTLDAIFAETPTPSGVIWCGALDAAGLRELGEGSRPDPLDSQLREIDGGLLQLVQALARAKLRAPLTLLTRSGQPASDGDCVSPIQATIWGLGRVIALEQPALGCRLLDLDSLPDVSGSEGEHAAARAAEAALIANELVVGDPSETQLALRRGERFAARLVRPRASQLGGDPLARPDAPSFELVSNAPGSLDELALVAREREAPAPGKVEVEVICAGLNFRDVMNAMGAYPGGPEPMGGECTGRITALGEGVEGFELGDHVIVGLARGVFRRYAEVDARFVIRKPAWVSDPAAVSLPVTFLTAAYGLHHLAKLEAGERVLIHAGAGGVGLAAIQLARRAGAEIIATAGSPRKRDLLRSLGVEHVYDSRSLEFAARIEAAGLKVDVVLNSLAGEFVTKSLGLLRPGGRFIEIGKVDLLEPDQVPAGIAYHHFDLGERCHAQHGLWREMFDELLEGIRAGQLRPLPLSVYPIEDARACYRHMAQGRHVGKLVLRVCDDPAGEDTASEPAAVESPMSPADPRGTYLITGGLGGIGLELASWLLERGAGRVALMSRRAAPEGETAARVEALRAATGDPERVLLVRGDVSKREEVAAALTRIAEDEGPPLRGILHAAGVLDDRSLVRLDWPAFAQVFAPKVAGAWHLHTLSAELELDMFVVFSSVTALLGNAGQGNYAAANEFLDALVHYRRGIGLPGLAVDWGIWREVGMAAADPATRLAPIEARGIEGIGNEEGLEILGLLLANKRTRVGVLPVDWSRYLEPGPIPTLFTHVASASAAKPSPARQRPSVSLTPESVGDTIVGVVRSVLDLGDDVRIDTSESLNLDSLMAVELRNRLVKVLGTNLPATLLFDYPSIDALSDYVRTEILAEPEPEPEPEPAPLETAPSGASRRLDVAGVLAAIDALSDQEQQQLLETLFEEEG